jgi:hypothetical protein
VFYTQVKKYSWLVKRLGIDIENEIRDITHKVTELTVIIFVKFIYKMRDLTGKIYKRRPILLLSLTLLFTQCMREEVIEDFTEVRESPAAVYCVLTPGEYIQVLLFRSVPFFDSTAYLSEDLVIYDADIRIFNDHGDTVRLKSPSSDGGYAYNVPIQYGSYTALQSDLPIQAGETYHLLVNIANGTELLRASTSVPKEAVQWDSFEIYNRRPSPRPTYPNEYKNPVYVIDTIADVRGSWSNQGAETRLVFTGYSHPLRMERAYEGFNDPYYIRTTDCCKHLMIEGYRLYDGRTSSHDGGYFTVVTLNPELEAYLRVYDLYEEDRTNIGFGLFLRLFNGVYPEYTNIEGGLGLFAAHLSDARAI